MRSIAALTGRLPQALAKMKLAAKFRLPVICRSTPYQPGDRYE